MILIPNPGIMIAIRIFSMWRDILGYNMFILEMICHLGCHDINSTTHHQYIDKKIVPRTVGTSQFVIADS
jgi:hypothetical protein